MAFVCIGRLKVGYFYSAALAICFGFLRSGTFSLEYSSFTVKHFSLAGWEYKSISNCKFQECVKMCRSERACISVNFGEASGSGKGCCALNGCGVEDRENKRRSLVFTPNCVYHQLRPTETAIVKGGKYGNCTAKTKLQACTSGWTHFNGSCYTLIESEKTWDQAKIFCESNSSHLVEIDSLSENNFTLNFAKTYSPEHTSTIWIGLRLMSGNYKWTDDTVALFTNWDRGEPNNGNSAPCGTMYLTGTSWRRAGYWNDDYCHRKYPFVCQSVQRAPNKQLS